MRKRWSGIIRLHVSEGERINPRGLGTQLFSAASPNQVIKINANALPCLGTAVRCQKLEEASVVFNFHGKDKLAFLITQD
jgi:hypothetical protein